jgi:hypothetical protein
MSDVTEFWRQFCEGTGSDLTVSGTFAFVVLRTQLPRASANNSLGENAAPAPW